MSERRGLLIACGEPSVVAALESLADASVGVLPVERILLPGGAWWLAEAAAASGNRLKRIVAGRITAVEAVSEMLGSASIVSIVIAGHQDCAWYADRHPRLGRGELVKRIGADMYAASDELQRLARRPLTVSWFVLVRTTAGWEPRKLF